MNIEERLALSYYEEIATLNKEHHISIVQHRSSHKIYVKKELTTYNKDVYDYLFQNPISFMPKIYAMFENQGILTVIEEYISGDSLEEILESEKRITFDQAVSYFYSLCDIVSDLHKGDKPIIHRDIKPSNITITPSNSLYLLDMNAGKFPSQGKKEDTQLLGTHGYAAPEQYGFGSSNQHTDIYSLGILLKHMLQHCEVDDHRISLIEPVIHKSTKMDASLRYDTIDQMVLDMEIRLGIRKAEEKPNAMKAFLPPGFRSGNKRNKYIAILGYLFILYNGLILHPANIKGKALIFEKSFFMIAGLYVVAISCNYLGIHKILPFCNHQNKLIRMIAVLLWDAIGAFVIVLLMTSIEPFLS